MKLSLHPHLPHEPVLRLVERKPFNLGRMDYYSYCELHGLFGLNILACTKPS